VIKRLIVLALIIMCAAIAPEIMAQPQPPNLVVILLDDAGFGNLSPYNSAVDYTPNIQKLADTGTIYERWYTVASWCIPTRYALLTGQAPTPEMIAADPGREIKPTIVTLPKYLSVLGYATGHFGKWHVTEDMTGADALEAGFDVSYPWPTLPGSSLYDRLETTKKFTVPAAEWIRQVDGPFFAYVAFSAPHTPHFPTFQGLTGQGFVVDSYYGIDWAIGEILRQIDLKGELANTLIIVISDNGPNQPLRIDPATGAALPPDWLNQTWKDNYPDVQNPLRWSESSGDNDFGWLWRQPVYDTDGQRIRPTSKGSVFEQGVRVPAIVRWPAGMARQPVDSDLRWTADIYATMIDLAGGTMQLPTDGRSLTRPGHSQLHIYNHPNLGDGLGAIVEDRWKWHTTGELYDLHVSTEEVDDVSDQYPMVVAHFTGSGRAVYLPMVLSETTGGLGIRD